MIRVPNKKSQRIQPAYFITPPVYRRLHNTKLGGLGSQVTFKLPRMMTTSKPQRHIKITQAPQADFLELNNPSTGMSEIPKRPRPACQPPWKLLPQPVSRRFLGALIISWIEKWIDTRHGGLICRLIDIQKFLSSSMAVNYFLERMKLSSWPTLTEHELGTNQRRRR
jgi:hypothetical protein